MSMPAEAIRPKTEFWEPVHKMDGIFRGFGHLRAAIPTYTAEPTTRVGKFLAILERAEPVVVASEVGVEKECANGATVGSLAKVVMGWRIDTPTDYPHELIEDDFLGNKPRALFEPTPTGVWVRPFFIPDNCKWYAGQRLSGDQFYYNAYRRDRDYTAVLKLPRTSKYMSWDWAVRNNYPVDPQKCLNEIRRQGIEEEVSSLWNMAMDDGLNPGIAEGVARYLTELRATADPAQEPWLALVQLP